MDHRSQPAAALDDRHAQRIYARLLAPRASDEEDRHRELALNGLLLASLVLALVPAIQRAVQISHGGPDTADHRQTLVVTSLAAVGFGILLWRSRRGHAIAAAWGLLALYYGVGVWSSLSEGPAKSLTILICVLLVIAAGVVCGSRLAAAAATLAAATLTVVTILHTTHVVSASAEARAHIPDAASLIEIVGTLGAIALLLSTRTREPSRPIAELLGDAPFAAPLRELRTGALTVRELEVLRLIAAGRSNQEISRELLISPRTVESHVSSALRKAACSTAPSSRSSRSGKAS